VGRSSIGVANLCENEFLRDGDGFGHGIGRRLIGAWGTVYLINALLALYLNFFVLVAQLFQKTPALKELAPTQSEPPFAIFQSLVLLLFVVLGVVAVRKLRADSRPMHRKLDRSRGFARDSLP
jgi:hypothetical protein